MIHNKSSVRNHEYNIYDTKIKQFIPKEIKAIQTNKEIQFYLQITNLKVQYEQRSDKNVLKIIIDFD